MSRLPVFRGGATSSNKPTPQLQELSQMDFHNELVKRVRAMKRENNVLEKKVQEVESTPNKMVQVSLLT